MKRKEFLKKLSFSTATILSTESILSSCMSGMHHGDTVVPQVNSGLFINPLKIPKTVSGNTSLVAQNTTEALMSSSKVSVLGYGEGILGPTIRVKNGENVNINLVNKLSDHTNIHWHGLKIPADMDGHPDQMVMPNETFNYKFKVNQQAGTNWYHPHLHESTAEQVTLGLAGLFIVESDEEKALGLPKDSQEIPLIIQDKRIKADGSINYQPTMKEIMTGYLGENILVNGTSKPFLDVSTRFYRLRILNASSARIYNLALSNKAEFYLIGSDGGLLFQPEPVRNVLISTGERVDILVDFSLAKVGEVVFLKSEPFFTMGNAQGNQPFDIMAFHVKSQATDTFKLPNSLLNFSKLSASTNIRSFTLTMDHMAKEGMHKINNKIYKSNRIDETVVLGSVETWDFDNSIGDEAHPMHIHGANFQLVSRMGGRNAIFPHEKAWKDTVLVGPGEKVRVMIKFEIKGKFVLHCHNLEHEDDGMMLNFEVK
ncbi:multicopper oxidase family protein [Lacihabitans soyangensis]|uniref:Bilirubin oxidase n=1 Tax=Lacihabitans soyangensis TaxID=869394 RepID=A0AAE3KS87_9BACT|nr:multicopper oxidase domain-containing protein [Lacihabitans soyangensis]MCP9762324.1 bilirubin oxidase [Lacihabitans soyangensis]